MKWNKNILLKIDFEDIKNEEEKKDVANEIANKIKDGDIIGFGSGSTAYLTIKAIAEKMQKENIKITAIPTSYEVELLCNFLNIPTTTLQNAKPDWSFDGADEVNQDNWMIKGRGGAMFREKLNIANSTITYILVDKTKLVKKLGENFAIPVECYPGSLNYVKEELLILGAKSVEIRRAEKNDCHIIKESGNIILDARIDEISEHLEKDIKSITGVIESGLFIGYPVEVIS